jgi:hypothetical protein
MPPKAGGGQQPTTSDQMKFVMTQWLADENNRLSVFGGAGAKSAYGGKGVVKPTTAYNSLAQAVNAKFGTSWDGDSAKARLRTMKTKFHNVFTLCGGRVQEESDNWRLMDGDKSKGIMTLADKAQDMCPHWNLWLEWCGNDPNMVKHGSSDSSLSSQPEDSVRDAGREAGDASEGSEGEGDDDGGTKKLTYATFSQDRNNSGDAGNIGNEDGEVPRAVTARVHAATSGVDALSEQKRQRQDMLKGLSKEEKTELYRQESKGKRLKEQQESNDRRSAISTASQSGAQTASSPSVSSGSPLGKSGSSSDWQANFLVQRQRDEDLKLQRQEAASVTVAKLQIDAAARQSALELEHKQQMLTFQQLQFNAQQQQAQMQMQFQQQQQMLYVLLIPCFCVLKVRSCLSHSYIQMKQQEAYMNSVAQSSKVRADFIIAGLSANLKLNELQEAAQSLFAAPPAPPNVQPQPALE